MNVGFRVPATIGDPMTRRTMIANLRATSKPQLLAELASLAAPATEVPPFGTGCVRAPIQEPRLRIWPTVPLHRRTDAGGAFHAAAFQNSYFCALTSEWKTYAASP
ncbi:MAG TPA: hypothetical protein VG889_01750 [Rhizomicrobium sp.]|nr:hypothetical protein [Rhizomicrobium sp.]